jgi:cytochrome b561
MAYGEASSAPSQGYSGVMRAIHWTTLALLISIYALAWSVDGAGKRDEAAWLVLMHRSFGLTVMLLTLFRVGWRQVTSVPPLPDSVPPHQRVAARVIASTMYLLLFLQPALGLVASEAHGDRIQVFGMFDLPSFMSTNRVLSREIFALHGTIALVLLAVISVHACAGLYHHCVRRDDVLRNMLPGLRRQPGWKICRRYDVCHPTRRTQGQR